MTSMSISASGSDLVPCGTVFVPSGLSRPLQRLQSFRANRTPASKSVGFLSVYVGGANPDIMFRIWSDIAMACHAIFVSMCSALFPFSTFIPNGAPFLECKQKLYAALFSSPFMSVKGIAASVFFLFRPVFSILLFRCFWIRGAPHPHIIPVIRPLLFSVIFGFSHWRLSYRSVVRDGIGATTLVPSRLYHSLTGSAY